jgi:WD40 repeat protein
MSKVQVTRLHSLKGHKDSVYTVQPSSDESKFFSAAGDGMVALWDLKEPENGHLIAQLPNSIYALHFYARHNLLVAGHNYEGIHILDWENKKEVASLQITKAAIFDIQSAGNSIFVASGDGMVTRVDMEKVAIVNKSQASDKSARTIAINEGTGDMAVGYSDHFIRVFDTDGKLKTEWKGHNNSVFTLRYTPDRKYLISGSRDARLKVWDVQSGYHQSAEIVAHLFAINHLEFSPDGKHFVTCSMDKSIKVWDAEALKLLKVIDKARHAGHGTSVNKLLWTGHNNQLVSASDDRTISVWQIIF